MARETYLEKRIDHQIGYYKDKIKKEEARIETFGETVAFLERQRRVIATATSRDEYDRLVVETESVLLGETANWFSRRANTSLN